MTVQNQAPEKRKLNVVELVFTAWPMALVAVGGAIGGLCGGVGWAINAKIMSSGLSAPVRYGLCVLVGIGAIGLWLLAVFLLATAFPSLFGG
jgi:hypothetical protein